MIRALLLGLFLGTFSSQALGKSSNVDKPLMKRASVKEEIFTFEWHEPDPNSKYTLNIYRGKNRTPEKSLRVKGGLKSIKFKRSQDKIYWSVTAENVDGSFTKNKKKFLVPGSELDDINPTRKLYIVRLGYQHFSSSYEQSAAGSSVSNSKRSESLSGSAINFRGEIWKEKFGIIAGMRKISLSSGDTDYSEIEFLGDIGYKIKSSQNSSHILAAGFNSSAASLSYSGVDADYMKHFFTFRYQYDQNLSNNLSMTVDTTLLQPARPELITPSLRIYPMLNWHYSQNWWLSLMAGYEMNKSTLEYKEDGKSGDLDFKSTITIYGVQINWKSF